MVTRADIVTEAKTWLNVPYKDKGRNRFGIDCAGLVMKVGQETGISDYESTDYPRRPDGTFVQRFRDKMDTIVPITEAQPGDVLLFAESGCMCHSAIMILVDGQPGIIHSHAGYRGVIEETLESAIDDLGRPRFAFSYRGLED